MAQTPEGKVKDKVRQIFKQHGVWYFLPGNNGFGKSGIPDFVACLDGKFLGVECKADRTKKPTELQVRTGQQIRDAGGQWLVVCDEESLSELLSTILKMQHR